MKSHVLLSLALVLSFAGTVFLRAADLPESDDPGKRAEIKKLLVLTGSREMALQAIDQMIGQFKQTMPQVPDDFWKDAAAEMKTQIDDLLDLCIPAYERQLTHDEIKELVKFYESPIGRKLVAAQPQIQMDCMQAGQEWGQKIGEKVAKKLQQQGKM